MLIRLIAKKEKKNYVNKTFTLFLSFIILSLFNQSDEN